MKAIYPLRVGYRFVSPRSEEQKRGEGFAKRDTLLEIVKLHQPEDGPDYLYYADIKLMGTGEIKQHALINEHELDIICPVRTTWKLDECFRWVQKVLDK